MKTAKEILRENYKDTFSFIDGTIENDIIKCMEQYAGQFNIVLPQANVIKSVCSCGGKFKYIEREGYVCQKCGRTKLFAK